MKILNKLNIIMFSNYKNHLVSFLSVWLICFLSCTENPFSEEEKISQNSISGRVELNNHSNHKDIFVWFEVLNVSTRTDSNGFFTLNIPSPAQQPGGGIDGLFDLYFYVANYELESVEIAITNGKVQYSDLTFNNDGELKQPIQLKENLNIVASFSEKTISESQEITFFATFTVVAAEAPVTFSFDISNPRFKGDPEYLAGLLLNANGKFVKFLKLENYGYRYGEITVGNSAVDLEPIKILINQGELASGLYEVVPYILIQQKDLPAELLSSIGENVTSFTPDFLKIPLRIKNNKLQL